MRTGWIAVIVVGLAALSASAQSAEVFDQPAATRWVAARIRASRMGHADLVQVPVAFASLGWGCTCPGNYVGYSPDVGDGPAWLALDVAPDVEATLPEVGPRGAVMMLEGYFSGSVTRFVGDAGTRYATYTFVVTRLVAPHTSDEPRMRVVRAGAFDCTSTVTDTTPLRVHARSGARSDVVGEVPPGASVVIRDVRGEWLSLSAPATGWVSAYEVTTRCTAASN